MVVAKQHPSTQLDLSATRMQELITGGRPNALSQWAIACARISRVDHRLISSGSWHCAAVSARPASSLYAVEWLGFGPRL